MAAIPVEKAEIIRTSRRRGTAASAGESSQRSGSAGGSSSRRRRVRRSAVDVAFRVDVGRDHEGRRVQRRDRGVRPDAAQRTLREVLARRSTLPRTSSRRSARPRLLSDEWRPTEIGGDGTSIAFDPRRPPHLASLMLASAEHLEVVQERLGWASAAFLLKTCTTSARARNDAAQRFADRIFDAGEAG